MSMLLKRGRSLDFGPWQADEWRSDLDGYYDVLMK